MRARVWLACVLVLAGAAAAAISSRPAAAAVISSGTQPSLPSSQLLQPKEEEDTPTPAYRQLEQQATASSPPLVVAHRGASGPLPEHTAPAYLQAIQEGADFIECDVVLTRDLQLICRHEPNLNDTTDAWQRFRDRATTYTIDGEQETGVFAADLTLAEVRQLKAKQRWVFRDHSFDGHYGIVTFEEFIALALAAGRPVGIYPEAKHPSWHNQLPGMQAAHTTLEALMVAVLHAKGYAASAPYGSPAWQSRPIFIQSFEVTSLRRFAALTLAPLALLLDKVPAPDTGLPVSELLSDAALSELSTFVTVMAPWKAMLYTLVDRQQRLQQQRPAPAAAGLVLLSAHTAANGTGTDSSRRLLGAQADAGSGAGAEADSSSSSGGRQQHEFTQPDVPLGAADRELQGPQHLRSTGLAARLHRHGFLVHAYTLRDEAQFVMPTCHQQGIACEFEFLFESERLDGGFADWPGTMRHWVQGQQQP